MLSGLFLELFYLTGVNVHGQEIFQILFGFSEGELLKKMDKVAVGFQVVGLRRFNDAVEGGAGRSPLCMISEEPIFPTYGEGADRVFDSVVVKWYDPVFEDVL